MIEESVLPPRASQFRAMIEDANNFLATCDGGDAGAPDRPAIWLLRLEPGWSVRNQEAEEAGYDLTGELLENYSVELQLEWPFNCNAFKLLTALKGEAPERYAEFARRERPFERGSTGYFKGNLFPVACNNLGTWDEEHRLETGFDSKGDYQAWMRATRFPIVRERLSRSRPKLVICTGLTHMADFLTVTETPSVPSPRVFEVNGYAKRVHVATGGLAPVAIIPHLSGGVHSLNSYEAISQTAKYIKETLGDIQF